MKVPARQSLEPEQRVGKGAALSRALHQDLASGVGEHLGYLFTGIWSVLIGVGVTRGTALAPQIVLPGADMRSGRLTENVDPSPGRELRTRPPPIASARRRAMNRPRPKPPAVWVNPLS